MITYKKGLKYQIVGEPYIAKTLISGFEVAIPWIKLERDGTLTLFPGYAWDGSSGPTWDSSKDKQASAEHDAFYKLIRLGHLPHSLKSDIDKRYRDKCIEDGIFPIQANIRYWALRHWGDPSTRPSRRQATYYAP